MILGSCRIWGWVLVPGSDTCTFSLASCVPLAANSHVSVLGVQRLLVSSTEDIRAYYRESYLTTVLLDSSVPCVRLTVLSRLRSTLPYIKRAIPETKIPRSETNEGEQAELIYLRVSSLNCLSLSLS